MTTNPIIYPIDYTSRDYLSLREDLINLVKSRVPEWEGDVPSDFGVAMVESFAYVGDILNYYIDRVASEAFLDTATQRQSVINIAKLLGYSPSRRRSAVVTARFTNSTSADYVIPYTSTSGGKTTISSLYTTTTFEGSLTTITFEINKNPDSVDNSWTVPANSYLDIPLTEGQTYIDKSIGTTSGYQDQVVYINDYPLMGNNISIKIGSDYYGYVNNLSDASSADKVFMLKDNSDGSTSVIFGNGVNGVVPTSNQTIYATYVIGGGVIGNIPMNSSMSLSLTPVFYGSISTITAGVGGIDDETTESIRNNAARSFRTRNRVITLSDFQDYAFNQPETSKSIARGNYMGNVNLYIAPRRSGSLSYDPAPGYNTGGGIRVTNKAKATSSTVPNNGSQLVTLTLTGDPNFTSGTYITVGGIEGAAAGFSNVTVQLLGKSASITAISGAGGVVTVDAPNTFVVGQSVAITGASPYNGTWAIASASGSSFTYSNGTTGTATLSSAAANTVLAVNQGWIETNTGVTTFVYRPDTTLAGGLIATTACDGVLQGSKTTVMTDLQSSLTNGINAVAPVGTGLTVSAPRYLDLKISLTIALQNTAVQSKVKQAVTSAIMGMFDYDSVDFNSLTRKEMIQSTIIKNIPDVQFSTIDILQDLSTSTAADAIQAGADQIFRLLDNNLSITINSSYPGIVA